jgi:hypothetical protein
MISRYNSKRAISHDIPQGERLSVKGREVRNVSITFQKPTRGTGKRWGNGISPPVGKADQTWRYVCPVTGKVYYASTKGGKGWHKWE